MKERDLRMEHRAGLLVQRQEGEGLLLEMKEKI